MKILLNDSESISVGINFDKRENPIYFTIMKHEDKLGIREFGDKEGFLYFGGNYCNLIKEIEKRINHINHAEIMREDEKIQLRLLNELLGVLEK